MYINEFNLYLSWIDNLFFFFFVFTEVPEKEEVVKENVGKGSKKKRKGKVRRFTFSSCKQSWHMKSMLDWILLWEQYQPAC